MKKIAFTDFDEFSAAVRDVECRMMPHKVLFHRWSLIIAESNNIEVQYGSLGSGNILEGISWKNGFVFYLPLTSATNFTLNGRSIKPNSIMVLEPGGLFDLSSNAAHDWCTVFVPISLFFNCGNLSRKILGNGGTKRSFVTEQREDLVNRFTRLVRLFIANSEKTRKIQYSTPGIEIERQLLKLCRRIYAAEEKATASLGRPKIEREDVVKRAKEYININAYSDISVGDVANWIGVSERTLSQIFKDFFSIGPKRYIELKRIIDIRAKLKEATPFENSVTEILADRGILEFGRFSGRYRAIFGELPSDTLRCSDQREI